MLSKNPLLDSGPGEDFLLDKLHRTQKKKPANADSHKPDKAGQGRTLFPYLYVSTLELRSQYMSLEKQKILELLSYLDRVTGCNYIYQV